MGRELLDDAVGWMDGAMVGRAGVVGGGWEEAMSNRGSCDVLIMIPGIVCTVCVRTGNESERSGYEGNHPRFGTYPPAPAQSKPLTHGGSGYGKI